MYTRRCILRHWASEDAQRLYELAKDPKVGPQAGWKPHTCVEESKEIIETVFQAPETYAIVLKETMQIIGCVALMTPGHSNVQLHEQEAELGYWLGKDYWGQGIMPEIGLCLIEHGFYDLGLQRIYCGYYQGNEQSRRVQEKLGFQYAYTVPNKLVLSTFRNEIVSVLERKDLRK